MAFGSDSASSGNSRAAVVSARIGSVLAPRHAMHLPRMHSSNARSFSGADVHLLLFSHCHSHWPVVRREKSGDW